MKTLKDYCNLLNGYAFKSDEYVDDGIRVVRITNVQKGEFVDSDPKFYPLSSQKQLKDYLLQENDLLVSLTGNVGRVCMISKDFLPAGLNQRVACLRIKNKNLLKEYLYFYLMRNKFEEDCIHNSRGIAQLNLSTIWLENYPIKVPTPEQQTIVVDNLTKISKNISELKKNLHFFDELTKSRFIEMFGDLESMKSSNYKIGDVAEVNPKKDNIDDETEVTFLPMERVGTDGSIDVTLVKKYKDVKKGFNHVKENDVLFAKITPCMENGKSTIA